MTTVGTPGRTTTPWHVWVVGVLAFLWNAAGAVTILMAQAGTLPDLEPGEAAYYAAQPLWFVMVTNVALGSAVAGALALLLRRRSAVWLFGLSLAAIVITNSYELATGVSRMFVTTGALVVTVLIWVITVLELFYARAMTRR